jgi:hypothetical protein
MISNTSRTNLVKVQYGKPRVQTGLWRCKFACKKFYFLSLWFLSLHSTLSTPHIDFGRMQSWVSKFQCQKVNSEINIGYQGERIGDGS